MSDKSDINQSKPCGSNTSTLDGCLVYKECSKWDHHMHYAIAISRKGFGFTAPNPCVGAVLVRDDKVVAEGFHAKFGEDHAEIAALNDAQKKGVDPKDCTLLVTLEPCNHQGKTPPCTEAIVNAGIKHVVIGTLDPNKEAAGGAEYLRSQGITVESGVYEEAALDNIADFICWQTTNRPYTILKLASTLDGKIATRSGHSQWVTGQNAHRCVHDLRSKVQAVLVGGNTFYQDNPRLTARDENGSDTDAKQPLAVIATSRVLDSVFNSYLVTNRPNHTVFWTTAAVAASPKSEQLRKLGVTIESINPETSPLAADDNLSKRPFVLDLERGMLDLRMNKGAYYVLCEGGGKIALTLLEKGLVDELHLHLAPKILGDSGAVSIFEGKSPDSMDEAHQMRFFEVHPCGEDLIMILRPKNRKTDSKEENS